MDKEFMEQESPCLCGGTIRKKAILGEHIWSCDKCLYSITEKELKEKIKQYEKYKDKMVLVPVLDLIIMTRDNEDEFKRLMADAPFAAIPLTEIPESCFGCPCSDEGLCGETLEDTNYDTRPSSCPIVTKE